MSLLQPAILAQSAAKIGIFGKPGSGKTLSAMLLLIGLAKRDGGRPIAMMDTEGGSDFVKDICDLEHVPLLVVKTRTFVEMREALREAEAEDCSGFLVDSYSAPWSELNEAIREKLNLRGRKLQFEHRDELYQLWGSWTREMLASPLHCVLSGRLANDWDDIVSDDASVEHVKVGTKMRGESDAGYEPHLLIEMDAIRDSLARDSKTRSKRGKMVHGMTILKDRFRVLNGRSFQFPDINDYKAGFYAKTYAAVAPHIDRLAPRGRPGESGTSDSVQRRSSAELFHAVSGESAYSERARRVTVATEEIQAALGAIWPGQGGEEKRMRAIVLETVFKSRSWTAIEGMTAEAVEAGWAIVRHFESAAQDINLRDEAQVVALIASCKDLERERVSDMVT